MKLHVFNVKKELRQSLPPPTNAHFSPSPSSGTVGSPSSIVRAPLCELGDDGTEGGAEESGAVCTKEEEANIRSDGRPTTHCMSRTTSHYSLEK